MKRACSKQYIPWVYVIVTLATIVAFEPMRHNEFVGYDDDVYVTENPYVVGGISWGFVKWAFTKSYEANWHPLTWLSHMLDCELFGLNPFWHHLTNLLFHLASTLLLFWVFTRMTGMVWPSAFVSAAFGLHPLHVESVAWVAERKDVLSGFLWMLTMAAYLRYVRYPSISRYLLALLAFALGLMAKPMLVTLPFVLLLLDYWPLGRFQFVQAVKDADRRQGKFMNTHFSSIVFYRLVREKAPFFALSAISSIITFFVQQSGGAVKNFGSLPLLVRIFNAIVSYAKYIVKMIWPSRLAVFYPHPGDGLPMWQVVAAALLLLCISIWVICSARNHRYLLTGWLWYLGTLVPVIGFVQVGGQALADRYTYVPLIGLFIIIAWGLPDILLKWRYRKALLGTSAIVVLLALSICTHFQLRHWRNSITLFEHALDVTTDNYIAYLSIADALREKGKIDEAINYYRQSLQVRSNFSITHYNLANALTSQGKLDEAISHYRQALKIRPNYAEAHNNLANSLTSQGKLDEAIIYYRRALCIKPDHVKAHNNLGNVLTMRGKFDEAISHYLKALQLEPDYAEAHNNLSDALSSQGRFAEAIEHYRRALRLSPDSIDSLNNLAWIFAVYKGAEFHNPEEAIKLAEKVCNLTNHEKPEFLDTLAAAYAAEGRFSQAIEAAEKAIKLAEKSGQKELSEEIQKHLQLYKANQPYVESAPKISSD